VEEQLRAVWVTPALVVLTSAVTAFNAGTGGPETPTFNAGGS